MTRNSTLKVRTPRTARVVAVAALAAALAAPAVSSAAHGAPSPADSGVPALRAAAAPAAAPGIAPALLVTTTPQYVAPAPTTYDLCATSGSVTVATGTTATATLPVWGYAAAGAGDCATATVSRPGGPTLVVDQNAAVTINLYNNLAEPTSLAIEGQGLVPDLNGVGTGGHVTYSFVASSPGTFVYEAGLTEHGQQEIALGLYGALIVRPVDNVNGAIGNQAYDSDTLFDVSRELVLSELDPALTPANQATFDMRTFAPKYTLINGQPYPSTTPIDAPADGTVLLRYVNAGISYHSMSVLGLNQTMIASDGHPRANPYGFVAETFGPGQTADALLVVVPAGTPDGTKLPIFEGSLTLFNNGKKTNLASARSMGGMLTFINVTGAPPSDTVGPTITGLTAMPNPTTDSGAVTMTANATDPAGVASVELRVDGGPSMPISFTPGTTVTLSTSLSAGLAEGAHQVQVRATDTLGNIGGWASRTVVVDTTPPTVSGLTLTPNPSGGAGNVALHAAATDANNVTAAEYRVDGGGPTAFSFTAGGNVSLDASLVPPAPPASGVATHPVEVRARDAAGNWSGWSSIGLVLDKSAPLLTSASWAYLNQTPPPLRITATFSDATTGGSLIAAVEGRIDMTGTGFPFLASTGVWNLVTATAYGDIPPTTLAQLAPGSHTLYVRARDGSGNWTEWSAVPGTLTISSSAPTINSASAVTSTTVDRRVVLAASATVTAPGASINYAEWFTGTDPGRGAGTQLTITGSGATRTLSGNVDVTTFAEGATTFSIRVRDSAGNWSSVRNANVNVVHQIYFSTSGNANPPGVTGTSDDADVYRWNGSVFSRYFDARVGNSNAAPNVPTGADVDAIQVVNASTICVSFTATVNLGGSLTSVQNEDIVCRTGSTWSMKFDGSNRGLGNVGGQDRYDIDDFTITGFGTANERLYFTLSGARSPLTNLATGGDDADVYSTGTTSSTWPSNITTWNATAGSRYSVTWDATARGVPAAADLVGLSVLDASHLFLEFDSDQEIIDFGGYTANDVLFLDNGTFTLYFASAALTADPATTPDAIHVS